MKHYLVIQLARFGDLIQTKRLLATLCARENAAVHLCVDNSLQSLAQIVYPEVTIHGVTAHGTGGGGQDAARSVLLDNRHAFSTLTSLNFETIYNLNFSPLNFRLAALFDSDKVEGYAWKNGQEIIRTWPAMAMRWSDYRRVSINLVDFWAGYCSDMIAPDKVNPVASPNGGGIGVVLAGRESRRSLPVEVLSNLVSTMAQTSGANHIQLLGGPNEAAAGQAVLKQLPAGVQARTRNLAGKTEWADLVDVVGSLDLLMTPDTGTMHLAAHLGTPVHAFFLSSAWCFETGPYGAGHTVYQGLTSCLPCLESQPCPYSVKCLQGFADPLFQRFMATRKPEHLPERMLVLNSSFDDLGQTYEAMAGVDPDTGQREQFRAFMADYLLGTDVDEPGPESLFAQRAFREKDWIADRRPGSTIGL